MPELQETWVWSLGWEDTLEKEMATHSNILAWEILWIEEPGGLQSMGSQSARHHWVTEKTWNYTEINIVKKVLKRKHSYSSPFWKKKKKIPGSSCIFSRDFKHFDVFLQTQTHWSLLLFTKSLVSFGSSIHLYTVDLSQVMAVVFH